MNLKKPFIVLLILSLALISSCMVLDELFQDMTRNKAVLLDPAGSQSTPAVIRAK